MRKENIKPVLGIIVLLILLSMALIPSLWTSYDRKEMFEAWLEPFCEGHFLGTNSLGYDIWTEIVFGARESISVGVMGGVFSLLVGAIIGIAASFNGLLGRFFSLLINIFLMIPRLICLIVFSAFLQRIGGAESISSANLIMLITLFSWAPGARNVKIKVESLRAQNFVENLRLEGFSEGHIILFHIIPNLIDVFLSRFLIGTNSCIMMESTLAFLGLGNLFYPSWGTMINFAFKRGAFIRGAYAYLLSPGICIMLLSLAFYLVSTYYESGKDLV